MRWSRYRASQDLQTPFGVVGALRDGVIQDDARVSLRRLDREIGDECTCNASRYSGMPGAGDLFFVNVAQHKESVGGLAVQRISIHRCSQAGNCPGPGFTL